jgi:hypothetical protein
MLRRWSLGLVLSVAAHVLAVGVCVAWAFLRDAAPGAVDIDITGMRLDELDDLPLGAPAPGAEKPARPRARVHAPAAIPKEGTLASRDDPAPPRPGADDGTDDEGGDARVTDLRQLGPAGARFTLLMRVDRLKGTPFAEPVDALLMHMPDRRDLLEGTGLHLYDDFDALLVSTPDPLDYRVTFLAARHHLGDAAMRAAIDRGARATGRVVAWRTEDRRPWGERRVRPPLEAPPGARDERLIVLPAPGLVVVTPPAYRALLQARAPARRAPDAGADATSDAGSSDAGAAPAPSWTSLLRRIDGEDKLMPETGVAMVTAVDLLQRAVGGHTALFGVEIELPHVLTAVVGADPEPYVDVTAEFTDEAQAIRWEVAWPTLQGKLRTNPYLVLGGFSSIVGRITSTREGATVRLHVTSTTDETVRLLQVVATALPR